MSIIGANHWNRLTHTQRRDKILRFYKTNSAELVHEFLSIVRAQKGYGIYASIGPNYQYAVFGRDSVVVAEDILEVNQALAKEIILLLAFLQGREFNLVSEEEQGKIHHEYRSLYFSGKLVPKAAQTAFKKLAPHWGGTDKDMLYYGSFDATPRFVSLVHKYCELYGLEILDYKISSRMGNDQMTLREYVRQATSWFVEKITASSWKLFEFRRINPEGLYNQAWADSSLSYLHKDGTIANSDSGVAAIELQGHAYDALRAAAELVALDGGEANSWRHLASIVRNNTLERMWMDDEKYFAMGLDRSTNGKTRFVSALSSNSALLLGSGMLRLTPHYRMWSHIEALVKKLFSEEFMTIVGPRIRSLKYADLVSYADYHGSYVSWPKHTHAIALGLRNHGFYRLANLLDDCVLHAVGKSGEFYEFYYVDRLGRPKYHYRQENPDEPTLHEFAAAELPEQGQAWTISAIINIINYRHSEQPIQPVLGEVKALEDEILQQENVKSIIERLPKKLT
ncbi:MAG TPA: hypothetical protein VLA77_01800 [Candidatus Saccharimonadales bacterium]|nr:hypothetical protein [Candidatus Saccharimonadales bacterium]